VIKRISLIVEGKGDVFAAASLLTKVAAKFNLTSVVVGNPIRAGEAKKLRRAGELERFVLLAAGHNSDEIFILLDLDDGCPKDWQMEFHHRAETALEGTTKRVRLCFCLREFEGWFLTSIGHLREAPLNMAFCGMRYLQMQRIYLERKSNCVKSAVESGIDL
jgi:hypothetical protein